MRMNSDIEYWSNNGTISVRPSRTGRLKEMVKTTVTGKECVWSFKDDTIYTDDDGDERIDHHLRGAMNGTSMQGRQFLDMCREAGLVVQSVMFYIPFSNSQRRYARSMDNPFSLWDFREEELKLCRWDLPSEEELAVLIRDDS